MSKLDNKAKAPATIPSRGSLSQGKSMVEAFSEMEKEAMVVQYQLLRFSIHEFMPPSKALEKGQYWQGFIEEQASAARYGNIESIIGRVQLMALGHYGHTLNRALGNNAFTLQCEVRYELWVKEFIAKLKECVRRFENDRELGEKFDRLVRVIEGHEVGQAQARQLVEHFQTTIEGRLVLTGMREGKILLLARIRDVMASLDTGKAAAAEKRSRDTKTRSLAERLDAAPGAREVFDRILRMDGFTTDGQYSGPSRKNKAGILAAWDAVTDKYGLEGYGIDQAALAAALCDHIPGLKLGKRIRDNMAKEHPYRTALAAHKEYLKDRK